jgi:uncharacterized protein (TIGR00369 family)
MKDLSASPFARFLGLTLDVDTDGPMLRLPYHPSLIGNPLLPALHGGVIAAFMELCALHSLSQIEASETAPKTINVSIQYLRPGKAQDTWAQACIKRIGRTIAHVEVLAWQEDKAVPICALQAHFLLK